LHKVTTDRGDALMADQDDPDPDPNEAEGEATPLVEEPAAATPAPTALTQVI
jgi:hypothetical protein